jgi:hypothetical protein
MKLQDGIAGATALITILAALLSPLAQESFAQAARNNSVRTDLKVKNVESLSQPLDGANREALGPLQKSLERHTKRRHPASVDQLFQ